MAQRLHSPLLLLAALALALAVNSQRNSKVGAPWDADVNDKDVQEALKFALSEYNKASNDENHSRVLQVKSAQKQVSPLHHPSAPGRAVGTGPRAEGCGLTAWPSCPLSVPVSDWRGCSLTP